MRPRAIKSIASLSDKALFRELAEGLELIAEHVTALGEAADTLAKTRQVRGEDAIRALQDEEAAKFLILIDAVRCPRKNQAVRASQLGRFHDHLAKGIYVEVYEWSPASYGEVLAGVEDLRSSHYLDGPNDVDWIFRNVIEARREESLYVDLVEEESSQRRWYSPRRFDIAGSGTVASAARLVGAMHRSGFTTIEGLRDVAAIWRGFIPEESTQWQPVAMLNRDTLGALSARGHIIGRDDASLIVERWSFPLFAADLSSIQVDPESLRDIRARTSLG